MRTIELDNSVNLSPNSLLVQTINEELRDKALGGLINVSNYRESKFGKVIRAGKLPWWKRIRGKHIKTGDSILIPKIV